MPSPLDMEQREIRAPKQLLVEGKEDWYFFAALRSSLGITAAGLEIKIYDGKNRFRPYLRAFKNTPGYRDVLVSLGVVRDADRNATNAHQSVRDALLSVGLEVAKTPGEFGQGKPRTGVLILPGIGSTGMLEDLCLEAVREHRILPCVENYVRCLEDLGCAPENRSKTRLYAFLSAQKTPGLKVGEAASSGFIPLESPVFQSVKDFLLAM